MKLSHFILTLEKSYRLWENVDRWLEHNILQCSFCHAWSIMCATISSNTLKTETYFIQQWELYVQKISRISVLGFQCRNVSTTWGCNITEVKSNMPKMFAVFLFFGNLFKWHFCLEVIHAQLSLHFTNISQTYSTQTSHFGCFDWLWLNYVTFYKLTNYISMHMYTHVCMHVHTD